MDCFSCIALLFNEHTPAERNQLKDAIMKATDQVHMDYLHTLTERTITHYYKYNGPSTYNKVMCDISKRRDMSEQKYALKALAQMYKAIGLDGFAGIIIQYNNSSIIVNNNTQNRRSIPLYCTLQLSKVPQPGAYMSS